MKSPNFLKSITVLCIAIISFVNISILYAQHNDIIDLCSQFVADCDNNPQLSITVNYDGSGNDTIVIFENISGYRLVNPTVADKQYKFCAANNNMCSTLDEEDGEFHIRFESPAGTPIGVSKLSFEILNPTSGTITVTYYQGATGNTIAGTGISGGRKYVCQNNCTPIDSVVITSGYDVNIDEESDLFILDSLLFYYIQPTITLGSNPEVCRGTTAASLAYSAVTNSPDQYSIDYNSIAESQGFTDVTLATLSSSPISIAIPAGANAGTYNASLTVTNSSSGCTSQAYPITITVNALPTAVISVAENSGTTNNDGTICAGTMATLTASGGTGYAWSSGETNAAISKGDGTYTVTVTDANGCTDTESLTITETTNPTANINVTESSGTASNDGTVCAGVTATLTASGGTGYTWSSGETTAIINKGDGTYTVTVTDANNCTDTESETITETTNPTANINITESSGTASNDGTVCAGVTATLTASGGTSYIWSSGETTAIINKGDGIYTVTVTDANNCTDTESETITETINPTAAIDIAESSGTTDDDGTICAGTTATLTASGGAGYNWSSGETTVSINKGDGSYTVTVTDANNCTDTETETITETAVPTATISVTENSGLAANDGTICEGTTATLTAGGGGTYLWSSGETDAEITKGEGTYTVTVTNSGNCSDSETRVITETALPEASISISESSGTTDDDGTICAGTTATLTASGGTSYTWSSTETTANISKGEGTYTVTVTDANGCTDTETESITETTLPTAAIGITESSGTTDDDGTICAGTTTTLTASGGTSYSWSSSETTASISKGAGTYTVTVTDNNNCADTEDETITETALPEAAIAIDENSGVAEDDGTICEGETATLTASGGGSYKWSTSETTESITKGEGTYTVSVTDANNCTDTETETITETTLPEATITIDENSGTTPGDGIICTGTSATLTAGGGTNYLWSSTETTASISKGAGSYSVTVTDANNCTDTESRDITENALPVILATTSPETSCPNISSTVSASGGASYTWNNGLGDGASHVVNPAATTTYTVTGTDINGCSNTATTTAHIKEAPTDISLEPLSQDENLSYIGLLETDDPDAGGTYTYTLVTGAGSANNSLFEINDDELSSMDPLNYESNASLSIRVRSTDECNLYFEKSFTITVNDLDPEVVCVMDLSGSMNWSYDGDHNVPVDQQRLTYAKKALIAFTDLYYTNFIDDANYSLTGFRAPSDVITTDDFFGMSALNATNLNNLIADPGGIIMNLSAGGNTPLLAGVEKAMEMFESDKEKVIVLLSDGQHNCPDRVESSSGEVQDLKTQLANAGIKLYTIGFGQPYEVDEDLLDELAYVDPGTGESRYYDVVEDAALNPGLSVDEWEPQTTLANAYGKIFAEGCGLDESVDPLCLIYQGEIKQINIPVTIFDNMICFFVSWVTSNPKHLGVSVYTSNGDPLPAQHPSIKYSYNQNHTIITISNKFLNEPGIVSQNPWKLEINGSKISSSENYQYLVLNKSKKVKLKTRFDKSWYFTGDEMKIFLELLVENKRLTNLDKTTIFGSRPGEGLGNWLFKNKLTKTDLEKGRIRKQEELSKIALSQVKSLNLDTLQKRKLIENSKIRIADNTSSTWLKSKILIDDLKIKYPQRIEIDNFIFRDDGRRGDEVADDGIYTAVYKKLDKEGTYKFNISVEDISNGKNVKRETQLSKYVRVKIKPSSFIKDFVLIDSLSKEKLVYNITLSLGDSKGNKPSPNALKNISLSANKGELIGGIQANPDGTFTQKIALKQGTRPSQVKLTMNAYNQTGMQRLEKPLPIWVYIIVIGAALLGSANYYRRKKKKIVAKKNK